MFELTLRNLSGLRTHLASLPISSSASSSTLRHQSLIDEVPQDIVQDLRIANDKYRVDIVGTRAPANSLPDLPSGTSMDPELDEGELGSHEQEEADETSELAPTVILYLASLDFDRVHTPLASPPFDLAASARSALVLDSPGGTRPSASETATRSDTRSVKLFVGLKAIDGVPAHRQDAQTTASLQQDHLDVYSAGEGGKPAWIWSTWDRFDFSRDRPFWRESTRPSK